jgi:hypothetical protein
VWALSAVLVASFFPAESRASTFPPDNYDHQAFVDFSSALENAAIVARVRLISRIKVGTRPSSMLPPDWRPVLGEDPSCGYLYKAEVVESFKGSAGTFEFFSSVDDDFTGFDHDYLVIVFQRRPNPSFLDLNDVTGLTIRDEAARHINCLISQKYYVGRLEQSMYSFDLLAPQQFGEGEWLVSPTRGGIGWCFYPGKNFYYDRTVRNGKGSYGLKSWRRLHENLPAFLGPLSNESDTYDVRDWSYFRNLLKNNLGAGPVTGC